MMSEIGFLDPAAQANNESGDVPSPDTFPLSSTRAQHFPFHLGLENLQLFCVIFSHIHREGNVVYRGGGVWDWVSWATPVTLHSAVQVHPSLSDSLSPLFVFKSVLI